MINLLQTLNFIDEEISEVETLFFRGKSNFNAEQKNVINCFSKVNIQACPGSGKTTTLSAKLILLKHKLHKGITGGICVLTHTNIAVEMIKERLGPEGSNFYSNYPNYLGTIQSFVNKYLATPAYRHTYKKAIQAIDDDVFYAVMSRRQVSASAALSYLSRNKGIDHIGHLSFNIHNFDISANSTTLEPIVGKHTPSYGQLERLKHSVLNDGFMKYDEAYSLAFRYLREHPAIIPLFAKRFPIVFLDEMQDTEEFQFELINRLFGQQTILQTIGDGNQDIYGNYETIATKWPTSSSFSIATSSRFPQVIANQVMKVGVVQQSLIGRVDPSPLLPHIIVYKDATINLVKDKFGEILIQNNLHKIDNATFKAVGARKDAGQINITSYFSQFNKSSNKIKEHYDSIEDYYNALVYSSSISKNVKGIKGIMLSLFLQALKLSSVIDSERDQLFTATSFERYLKFSDNALYQKFRKQVGKWIKDLSVKDDFIQGITDFILNDILPHFEFQPNAELNKFLTNAGIAQFNTAQQKLNIYQASHNGEKVDIVFDSIHGVKGETHTGTLFLETYNRCFDLEKLLPLISGTQRRNNGYINSNSKRMKLAYVAMSRPTDLLCLAVHEDRIDLSIDWQNLGIVIVHC